MSNDNDLSTNVDINPEENLEEAKELLSEYSANVRDIYEKTMNERLVPLLREATNYSGEFSIVANYDVTIDDSTHETTDNSVTLSIKYGNELDPYNAFVYVEELIQRELLELHLKDVISRFGKTST